MSTTDVRYDTPGLTGSRSGSSAVTAWATLRFFGYDGLLKEAKIVRSAVNEIVEGIKQIPGLGLLIEPKMNMVCIVTEAPVRKVVADLAKKGWKTYTVTENPPCFNLVLFSHNAPSVGRFLKDLKKVQKDNLPLQ